MKVGRNEPCPCGSGKKYKKCCLRSGKYEADRSDPAVAAARSHAEWEMAVLPISANIGGESHSRPTAILVTAGRSVVHGELVTELSVEIPELAREMARHLALAVERTGARPAELRVDEADVVGELATLMKGTLDGIEVTWGPTRHAQDAWRAMSQEVFGSEAQHVAVTSTWGAWQQSEEWIRAMFSTAERFYRCRPWKHIGSEEDPVEVGHRNDVEMTASVMGSAGTVQGLVLATDGGSYLDDLELVRKAPGQKPSGETLAVSFASMAELPPESKREIRKLSLPLAGPSAYPMLHAINTRAGGLPRASAERFLAVLEAFVECFEQEDSRDDLLAGRIWHSADGAVRLQMQARKNPLEDWPGEVDTDHLESGRTTGAGADWGGCKPFVGEPGEPVFDPQTRLGSFGNWLEGQGFAAGTVKKHLSNAGYLFEYLTGWTGVRPEALHEYDLRTFLYDWYPRKAGASETEAKSLHASLEKLLAYLETELDLEFLWAPRLLRERDTFRARWQTSQPGPFWDPDVQEWRATLTAHLDSLAMLPRNALGDDEHWGQRMGTREADLWDELVRHWLNWRDDGILSGVTAWDELVPALAEKQHEWVTSPHERCAGKTPYQVILAERKEISARLAERRST